MLKVWLFITSLAFLNFYMELLHFYPITLGRFKLDPNHPL
jgi:hypothetical protein